MGSSIIGRIVPIPKGNWNSTKSYKKLDIVYQNSDGQSYIAKKDVPSAILLTNEEYWQILATGATGPQGIQGETGPIGPTGNVYYATFDVDFESGILYMNSDNDYTGPTFDIDSNGNLGVIV